jgi:propionyl-CoA carboxylase alpha chain
VRVDTGVFEGGEVSMFYDPMVAKLITWGEDREQAIEKMRAALDKFIIRGISTNISFLSALIAHEKFKSGNISTNTIAEEYPEGFDPAHVSQEDPAIIIAVVGSMVRKYRDRAAQIDGQLSGHRRAVPADWVVIMSDAQHEISVVPMEGGHDVTYDGKTYAVRTDWEFGELLFTGTINGQQVFVQVERQNQVYRLARGGSQSNVIVLSPRAAELHKLMPYKEPPDLSGHLIAPMPGLLVSVSVQAGDEVKAGDELAVLEAMKMENALRAERNGVVARVHFEQGASVEVDEVIMELE